MSKLPLTPEAVAQLLRGAGFVGWQIVRMGSIAMAESGLNGYATNVVHNPTSPAHRSIDIGLLQINSYWHGGGPDAIARLLDPERNALAAFTIFRNWGGETNPIAGYNAWTTYRNGAHVKYQQQAIDAARAVGA